MGSLADQLLFLMLFANIGLHSFSTVFLSQQNRAKCYYTNSHLALCCWPIQGVCCLFSPWWQIRAGGGYSGLPLSRFYCIWAGEAVPPTISTEGQVWKFGIWSAGCPVLPLKEITWQAFLNSYILLCSVPSVGSLCTKAKNKFRMGATRLHLINWFFATKIYIHCYMTIRYRIFNLSFIIFNLECCFMSSLWMDLFNHHHVITIQVQIIIKLLTMFKTIN